MSANGTIEFLMKQRNWWIPFVIIFVVSITGVSLIGVQTYREAPPIPDFISPDGKKILTSEDILAGQQVFQRYALMNYGTMFGDGASRGPDFTADALHRSALLMQEFYRQENPSALELLGAGQQVKAEIKANRYDPGSNSVVLTPAQQYAVQRLPSWYRNFFSGKNGGNSFQPAGYLTDQQEITQLSAFFYWGAWVCGTERPGKTYSYTHNWPYDPVAGNSPSPAVIMWSIIGSLGLVLGIGIVLYFYGRLDKLNDQVFIDRSKPFLTLDGIKLFTPTPTQKSTYKFFFAAILLFSVQVLAGILTVHDFVGFTRFAEVDLREFLPITIVRSWHVQLSILWIGACWIGASLFIAPLINPAEPAKQKAFINTIFWLIVIMVGGGVAGMYMGPKGMLGDYWYWLGNQGWEFVEPGKVWQGLLFLVFILWAMTLYRAIRPVMRLSKPWALPNWLVYSTFAVIILLTSGFIATPKTNFVIADFWRWCVIHMWAEAFFEVFTTVLIGYFMVLMGLVSVNAATRVIFIATLLFLGSGLLGISHNFYWNAKPVATMALGSVFSTLQVIPLILLTLEAWRFRKLPLKAETAPANGKKSPAFGLPEVFLFLLGVNFWNFFGAGVFGFIINLPVANYYEHGTYLTVNHGHTALMGVYGNLSLAGILFCCRLLFLPEAWNARLVRISFWSLNIGLVLMALLDLFPAGIYQFNMVLEHGLWYARSPEFINSSLFQNLTWMRIIGGTVFVLGGVIPLTAFIVSRSGKLKSPGTMTKETIRRQTLQPVLEDEVS